MTERKKERRKKERRLPTTYKSVGSAAGKEDAETAYRPYGYAMGKKELK